MPDSDSSPLYSSRITQTYIDYLRAAHPEVFIDDVLQQAGMTKDEVADAGHWFTQDQVDRFHEALVAVTGDENISRRAGRFGASARSINLLKQYIVGLVNIETVFASMAKLVPLVTKGATVKVKKLGAGIIEIVSTPNPGVREKLYQCENRLGIFEALPKLFTNYYANIEHPVCFHRGAPYCRYVVTWNTSTSLKLRLVRNYTALASSFVMFVALFRSPAIFMLISGVGLIVLNMALSLALAHQKSKELERVVESNHKMAEEQMESASTNYNNALLVQEIGQTTATIFDIRDLMNMLALSMQRRLPFDRGAIWLSDETGSYLAYSAGYGYGPEEKTLLENTVFRLDNPDSKGAFVRAFLDQKYRIVNSIGEIEGSLSAKSRRLAEKLGVQALLCVPIVFENKSMGILAVDNLQKKTQLKKSDVNLLQGIASHIAISINNSRSFQKLKASESRYRQTLESIVEGYFEIDRTNTIRFVNKAFCDLLDYTSDELLNSSFDRYFAGKNAQAAGALFNGIERDGRTVHFAHYRMIRKSGESIPVDLSASLIKDPKGRLSGFRGLIRDATDRLNTEKEKTLLENQLLQAKKMEAIGTLAGGIAHNFNNWLNGILGNATLIGIDAQHDERIGERVRKIEGIVDSAARMTRQLLGYARGGKYKVDLVDVNSIIKESAETFTVARKDIAIQLSLDQGVTTVRADKSQIEQVLWNLYVNAVDAMPGGGNLVIETKNITSEALKGFSHELSDTDFVCFSMSDSGSGIDPRYRENIFEPFFTTKGGKGTGLGLASVYGIVKSHGGYVDVESSRGKGSKFSVYLPAAAEEFAAEKASLNDQTVPAGCGTILLVDDDETILDTCGQLLNSLGYTTLAAQSGQKALEIYAKSEDAVDLVIIDMIMPSMSGKELYARLKEINPCQKTLLSSGYSLNEQAQKILDSGCNGFIQKPFTISRLSEMIRGILS